jgi:hypothetical protein
MEPLPLDQVVRNIDLRLGRVEQIFPTLATKEELRQAVEPLATKEELRVAIAEAIAPLATKEELHQTVHQAVHQAETGLTAKLTAKITEEGERTRRYFDIVAEKLQTEIRLVAEGYGALHARDDGIRAELKGDIAQLDRRVTRLEGDHWPPKRR